MSLTRREFVTATACGLSFLYLTAQPDLFAAQTAPPIAPPESLAAGLGKLRHIHLEIPAGPHVRAFLAQTLASLADVLRLPAPERVTALGARLDAETYPAEFALTLDYARGPRLVIRASRAHTGPAELTLRGERGALNHQLDGRLPLSC